MNRINKISNAILTLRCSNVLAFISAWCELSLSYITLSAPLQYKIILSFRLRITDIRLRTLLKSNMLSNSYSSVRPCTSIVIEFGVRYLNTKPKLRAADTSAASSGDCAWYSSLWIKKKIQFWFCIIKFEFGNRKNLPSIFIFRHNSVAECKQSKKGMCMLLIGLNSVHQWCIKPFEIGFKFRIEWKIDWLHILSQIKKRKKNIFFLLNISCKSSTCFIVHAKNRSRKN